MIYDHLSALSRYTFPFREEILNYLKNTDLKTLSLGQHDILGDQLFVRVMQYEPKLAKDNQFETHRRYADLQYVAEGYELMQWAPEQSLKASTAYDDKGDYQFYHANDAIADFPVYAGQFTIFYPGEAHRPACQYGDKPVQVKKLVFKIKIG